MLAQIAQHASAAHGSNRVVGGPVVCNSAAPDRGAYDKEDDRSGRGSLGGPSMISI